MKTYDVIMTLGNGLTEDWQLPPIIEPRLKLLADLYKQGISDKVLISGGYSISFDIKGIKPPTTEGREMKKRLIELGVKEEDILAEEESRDTIGNFYFSKIRFLKPQNLKNILILCTDFHLKRVKFLSNKIMGPEYQLDYQTTPSESINDKDFMQIQEDILNAQAKFLEGMGVGEDAFLEKRLYDDPYYKERRPEKGAQITMRGAK